MAYIENPKNKVSKYFDQRHPQSLHSERIGLERANSISNKNTPWCQSKHLVKSLKSFEYFILTFNHRIFICSRKNTKSVLKNETLAFLPKPYMKTNIPKNDFLCYVTKPKLDQITKSGMHLFRGSERKLQLQWKLKAL